MNINALRRPYIRIASGIITPIVILEFTCELYANSIANIKRLYYFGMHNRRNVAPLFVFAFKINLRSLRNRLYILRFRSVGRARKIPFLFRPDIIAHHSFVIIFRPSIPISTTGERKRQHKGNHSTIPENTNFKEGY